MGNMAFNVIHKNKMIAKISEFTVGKCVNQKPADLDLQFSKWDISWISVSKC